MSVLMTFLDYFKKGRATNRFSHTIRLILSIGSGQPVILRITVFVSTFNQLIESVGFGNNRLVRLRAYNAL